MVVTGAYWSDTITDGAIRVLVLFYFYERGYSPFAIASLFLFYEVFGIITNLVGGFLAARFGLRPRSSAASSPRPWRSRCSRSRRSPGWWCRT